jgi:hypothetical protein
MRVKVAMFFVCGLWLAAAWLCLRSAEPKLRLSVLFLGYTNISDYGTHVAVIQVSNASPFAGVRSRSPEVVFNSPAVPVGYAPTGWAVLGPGESEQVWTESLTNGICWRFVVRGERLGDDSYGIGRQPRFRVWRRQVAFWLQGHGVRVATPGPPPCRVFSTAWIDP